MIARPFFTESAQAAFVATGLNEKGRTRIEALLIWEINSGHQEGARRTIEFDGTRLEFTLGIAPDGCQVTDVRLLGQAREEPESDPSSTGTEGESDTVFPTIA